MRCVKNIAQFRLFCLLLFSCSAFTQESQSDLCSSLSHVRLPDLEPQPVEHSISVLLLNWKRPANVKLIIDALNSYDEVRDIILMHNLRETQFETSPTWTKVISVPSFDLHGRYGMMSRIKGCMLADSSWVLMVDDDLITTRCGDTALACFSYNKQLSLCLDASPFMRGSAIQDLIQAKLKHPNRIIGFYGRSFKPHDPQYELGETGPGSHPIIIGRVMLTDTRFCSAALHVTSPMDDISYSAATKWGAEDIDMSLVASTMSGLPNLVILPSEDKIHQMNPGAANVAISGSPTHYMFRTQFLQKALHVLQCLKPQPALSSPCNVKE